MRDGERGAIRGKLMRIANEVVSPLAIEMSDRFVEQ